MYLVLLLCIPGSAQSAFKLPCIPGSAQSAFNLIMDLCPFFDLIIPWAESSEFGPKSDDLGHRILKSDFVPSDFALSDCIRRPTISHEKYKSEARNQIA